MTKLEVVSKILDDNPTLAQFDIQKVTDVLFETVAKALETGVRVEVRGFGAFSSTFKPEHTGRNPRTGEPVKIAAKYALHFRPGKELKERLNRAA